MTETSPSTELSKRIRQIPRASGVYLMKDEGGVVLYIGKAKDLKARVQSYFSGSDSRYRIRFLVERINSIETIVTETESQALILESDLIKKYKPHYNVRLKDDKSHLLVRIDFSAPWPRLELVRQPEDDGAHYIGPFVYSSELRQLLETVKRTFPLRTCNDRMLNNRVRPCLEFQIKRCLGPCCHQVDREEYLELAKNAVQALEGKNAELIDVLTEKMNRASAELRYEDAAVERDRIGLLNKISEERPIQHFGQGSRDAVGIHRIDDLVEVSFIQVRFGRLYEAKTFGFDGVAIEDEELLSSVVSQFYLSELNLPDEIILPARLEGLKALEQVLEERSGKAVKIVIPKKGPKKRLLELASENVQYNFNARFLQTDNQTHALKELQLAFELEDMPRTIECVDVSHFQGGSTVGSLVHFRDGVSDTTRYRHFNLSQEGKPDDFASMREILLRHLSRAQEENTLVDLLVVDGGQAQLAQATKVKKELGLEKPYVIGLAKKRSQSIHYRVHYARMKEKKPERVFLEGHSMPVILKPGSKALTLLEQLRNEAHRFAITFHRAKRSKKLFQSELDLVQGVGSKRRLELLREFGSIQAIKESTPEELLNRCQIPLKLGERILKHLNQIKEGSKEDNN